nr:probable protein phosphatase 2C 22 [Physcomitrium patens]XP_024378397.1 probable protein phosphatase 2C 22 [Physcomitrium patens]XP_024378398.1 probable protein phosphatase 2C 22 [Physcomitrium patens]XP_024378399.1 probable protein phosphatase 2C 22 [Physcomitrium patens]XP_024378400.1 probable protein phosphatase 2C 22 [Physcomitrium patens]XP_024378401.1 probable protein phosphatase 2C 22 [Physcomitrium patens]XP_024378402.1 probable protein phosphatase 2C 22 [Physcomitrium patens]XP_0|eukprot:XP_024378396.1 probable protein phosphatase 2C 22 [Physcomitrella patens]
MVHNERERPAEARNLAYAPKCRSGGCSERGKRRTLEDALVQVDDLSDQLGSSGAFYGVFDGHDGADAALYAKEHLLSLLLQDPLFSTSVEKAVKKVFLRLDRDFKEACQRDSSLDSGTTALIGLLQSRHLLVANAGDCRAVLCRRGLAIELSDDHTPLSEGERKRIESAGGTVTETEAVGYVNGQLSVARSIGDWFYDGLKGLKGHCETGPVIAEPEIRVYELSEEDEFLLLGCDGLWNKISSQTAVQFARNQLMKHNDPKRCSEALVQEALMLEADDNVTVITVCFQTKAPPDISAETPREPAKIRFNYSRMEHLVKK